jgi:Ras-related protein Rab-22
MTEPSIVKIVLLGSSGVGKSSIINRYLNDFFDEDMQTTVGAAYVDKLLFFKGKFFKFQIWDTAGQERYGALAQMYYRDADVAILVYDSTCKDSFMGLKQWHMELNEKGPKNIVLAVVGNKAELLDEEEVPRKVGQKYADKHNAIFKTTSAKENKGIKELFEDILDEVLDHHTVVEDATSDLNTSKLACSIAKAKQEKSKYCCV